MRHPLFETFGLKEDSFQEIKKRIYIVGKFNGDTEKKGIYLFSKRNRQDENHYMAGRCLPLSYDTFLSALSPSLTERHYTKKITDTNKLDYFELLCQTGAVDGKNISIDESNYFFQRATSSSGHPKFKKAIPNLRDILEFKRDKGIQEDSSGEVGEGIYVQVRKCLKDFCAFQTRNMEIVAAVSNLIAANTDMSGLPFFKLGQLLPVNFVPTLLDYLYEQGDNTFDKNFDNINFSADLRNQDNFPITIWKDAYENDVTTQKSDFKKSFVELMTWFKNYLLDPSLLKSYNSPRSLQYKEALNPDMIAEEFRKDFLKSRDSFNVLNQIIKSKVLLSMILSWAIDRFETLPADATLTPNEKNEAIDAIISKGQAGVAAPDQTFKDEYDQKSAKQNFRQHLPVILAYVADKASVLGTAAFAALPDALKAKAAEIEADAQKKKAVTEIMEQEKKGGISIISTIENIIVDDLFSEMFKKPGLSLSGLKDRMGKLQSDLFLTSSILKVTKRDGNRKLLTQKLSEGINRNPGAKTSMDEDPSAPSDSGEDQKSRIQESNFNKLLGNGVDVLIDILNDKEINESRKGVLAAIRNREIIENLGLNNSDLLISNYIPLLPPDAKSKGEKLSKTVVEPLVMAILDQVNRADAAGLKKKMETAIADRKKTDKLYVPSEFEQALANYLDDKSAENFSALKEKVKDDIGYYNENLALLYETYNKADHLEDFKNRLETATLSKLLILEKKALDLEGGSRPGTNLLDMLLDLVEQLDSSNPNLADFFARNSLTKYISKEIFREGVGGYGALKTVLNRQSNKSLDNIVQYVSELQGLRYLFEHLDKASGDAEIVLLNFDHTEFIDWLINQHIQSDRFLNPVNLFNDSSQFPCCIVMSELAFGNTGAVDGKTNKTVFLQNLQNSALLLELPQSVQIIPPIVLAAGSSEVYAGFDWDFNLLNRSMAPIIMIEPSLPLNNRNDTKFPTILSAAYLFAAQVLAPRLEQKGLTGPQNINKESQRRIRVIGRGVRDVSEHLREIIDPKAFEGEDAYAFDADYYLYVITLIRSAVKFNSGARRFDYTALMNYFLYDDFNTPYKANIALLDDVLIFSKMSDWSLNTAYPFNNSSVLNGVSYSEDMKDKKADRVFNQAEWFTKQSLLFKF